MVFFLDENLTKSVKGKYFLLDTDFLSALFNSEELFARAQIIFSDSYFAYDKMTAFEFLRDIFVPKQRIFREQLLSKDIFFPLTDHQEIYTRTQDTALILSKMYSHHGLKSPGFVDIFLASRLMSLGDKYYLITGNKKDFPNFIFDTKGIITVEEDNGSLRNYSILSFNRSKFDQCFSKLSKVEI